MSDIFKHMALGEVRISGNITYRPPDTQNNLDGYYSIISPNGQGWGVPTRDIEPDDLRKLADHLEANRGTHK